MGVKTKLLYWTLIGMTMCIISLDIFMLQQQGHATLPPIRPSRPRHRPKIDFSDPNIQGRPFQGSSIHINRPSVYHNLTLPEYLRRDYEHVRRPRVLAGVFTTDSDKDGVFRERHRELLELWNDTRTCSLPEWKAMVKNSTLQSAAHGTPNEGLPDCQLIYTFVAGANPNEEAPTQIVKENSGDLPLERPRDQPLKPNFPSDLLREDVTLLNIKENMNDGKSPTYFYFASTLMEEYHLDYAMKIDGDSILHLDEWFLYAHNFLPPPPYARNTIAGAPRTKARFPPSNNTGDAIRLEQHWNEEYDGVHLYIAGQCYLLSADLCQFVAQEASMAGQRLGPGGYLEHFEDHDISAMVDHNPGPVHFLPIGKSNRFWEHPVKRKKKRWARIIARETARVKGEPFEGTVPIRYLDL